MEYLHHVCAEFNKKVKDTFRLITTLITLLLNLGGDVSAETLLFVPETNCGPPSLRRLQHLCPQMVPVNTTAADLPC